MNRSTKRFRSTERGPKGAYGISNAPANRRFPWGERGAEGGTVRPHAARFA
jgi:hypothetical protein